MTVTGNTQINTSIKKFGTGSIYFDGSSDVLSSTNTAFNLGAGDFAIEGWYYFTDGSSNTLRVMWSNYAGASWTTNSIYYGKHTSYSGVVSFWAYNYSSNTPILTDPTLPPDNTWVHYALTRSGNTIRLFRDGVVVATTVMGSSIDFSGSNNNCCLGAGDTAYYSLSGYIDDFRITKGVPRYTTNFTPPTSALPTSAVSAPSILRWDDNWANVSLLLTGDGTNGSQTFTDLSGSPKTLTTYGNAQISATQFKYGSGAMYFDGTGDYLTMPSSSDLVFQSDFTMECWVYRVAASAGYDALYTANATQAWDANGAASAFVWSAGGFHGFGQPWTPYSSGASVPTGTWTHMAVSKFNNTVRFFMNGTQTHTLSHSGDIGVSSQTQGIGIFDSYTGSPRLFFNGYIDEFRITKGVARYTAPFTPTTYSLPTASGTSIDPNYSNVSLLLRGTGTNGSQTFTDEATPASTISTYGNAQISTSVKKFGTGSMYFDGNGDYLTAPASNAALNLSGGNWTIEFWAYYTGTDFSNYRHIITKGDATNGPCSYQTYLVTGTGYIAFYNGTVYSSSTVMPSNQWCHLAYVYSGGTLTMYLNGSSIYTNTATITDSTSRPLMIGNYSGDTSMGWIGYLDDIRITKGIARYTVNFTPPTYESPIQTGTTVDPNFSQVSLFLTGSDLLDHSSVPKTLSVVGNTAVSTSTKKYGTGSLYFDGSGDYITAPWSIMPTGTNNFTIEFWKYASSSRAAGGIFGYRASAGDNFQIYENWPTSGEYLLLNDSTVQVGINRTVPLNTWEHFAWVRNGNSFLYFINGVLQTTVTSSADFTKSYSTCYLGDKLFSGGYDFNGYISDLRVTPGVARYTTGFTPPTQTLPLTGGTSTLGTAANPASNIAALRAAGNTTDGMYYFKNATSGSTTFQAYCKFNYIDGNDWYLLLKVHNQGDMTSGSTYWTNTTLYNETDSNLTSGTWSKYATWNYVPFTRVMMQMTQGGTTKIPPIMIYNTSRTFAQAITAAGTPGNPTGVLCDSTDPVIPTSATYWNMAMKSGTAFTDSSGMEDIMQGYGIGSWANNASNSTTAEGYSSLGRSGAWIGCPLDEGAHTFNATSNTGADSGFGFGGGAGNTAKTFSAGYAEWSLSASTNTLPGYVWVR